MSRGVSIVICCYNSSDVLPETLGHICRLKVSENISWEVIVVDNASTDGTGKMAQELLDRFHCPAPYKIINEKKSGLSFARRTGVENSEFDYVLFCDDDNRLDENYLEIGFNIMNSDSNIAALGGYSEAVSEGNFPDWFDEFKQNYSVGNQSDEEGDITHKSGVLWGAGMMIRKPALLDLYAKGFKSLLSDRNKNSLTSGGDIEFCYALRLAGWKIWYSSDLKLTHFISAKRLRWDYLRKLNRGFGAQKANFDPYIRAIDFQQDGTSASNEIRWTREVMKLAGKLRGYGLRKLIKFKKTSEGDAVILRIEKTLGKLNEMLKIRSQYDKRIISVKNADWKKQIK